MGSSEHLRAPANMAAISVSVCSIVAQMRSELHSLVRRSKEVERRIRKMHAVMRFLQETAGAPSLGTVDEVPRLSSPDLVIRPRSGHPRTTGARRQSSHRRLILQRACRIALLETEASASLEEIYTRIVRRGSFSFISLEQASPILVGILGAMFENGEIRLVKEGPSSSWERIAPAKDI